MQPSDLYGLPLDRFIPERTALAKALRGAGDREQAAQVGKLAKPSVAAWVVNQLVRSQPAAVTRLLGAGDALREAQRDIIEGRGGAGELRAASAAKREALDELVATARGLLDAQGHSPSETTLARVSSTLDAAALQDSARERVSDGCLVHELAHIGLGDDLFGSRPAAPPSARRERAAGAPATAKKRARQAAARAREEERARETERAREAAARRQAAARAERERARAQTRRDRAAQELQEARERLDASTQALAQAERELAEASQRAQEAADAGT